MTVSWGSGGSQEPGYFEVTEYPDRVEIGVVDRLYNGPQNDDARTDAKPAALSAPLGDRVVVDAYNGRVLQQIGPRPGQPPCPPAAAEPEQLQQAMATRAAYGMRADAGYVAGAPERPLALHRGRGALARIALEQAKSKDEQLVERLHRDFPKTYAGSRGRHAVPGGAPTSSTSFTRDAQLAPRRDYDARASSRRRIGSSIVDRLRSRELDALAGLDPASLRAGGRRLPCASAPTSTFVTGTVQRFRS